MTAGVLDSIRSIDGDFVLPMLQSAGGLLATGSLVGTGLGVGPGVFGTVDTEIVSTTANRVILLKYIDDFPCEPFSVAVLSDRMIA